VQKLLGEGLARSEGELLQVADVAAHDIKTVGRKACPGNAAVEVTGGSNFPGGRAADDLNPGKQTPQFLAEHIEIVRAGTEENDQRHVWLRQPRMEFASGFSRVNRTGMRLQDEGLLIHIGLIGRPAAL
jgi:hypothetical protein